MATKTGVELPLKVKEAIESVGKEKVRKIVVQLPGNQQAVGYVFVPEALPSKLRTIYSRSMSAYKNGSTFDAGEIILGECWIDGDARFRDTESKVYMSACQQCSDLVDFLPTAISAI